MDSSFTPDFYCSPPCKRIPLFPGPYVRPRSVYDAKAHKRADVRHGTRRHREKTVRGIQRRNAQAGSLCRRIDRQSGNSFSGRTLPVNNNPRAGSIEINIKFVICYSDCVRIRTRLCTAPHLNRFTVTGPEIRFG
jgi:hypothetical protein